jgi:ElaB/YqjD/DUF883 family membrane-anchored ribosome-binding protein
MEVTAVPSPPDHGPLERGGRARNRTAFAGHEEAVVTIQPMAPNPKNSKKMKSKNTAAHTPKELVSEMQALLAEAQAMMADSVTEHSADAINALRARFEDAQERFSEIYENTREKVVAGAHQADTTIRANPYQSIAIAAGVGLLIGVLLNRNNK